MAGHVQQRLLGDPVDDRLQLAVEPSREGNTDRAAHPGAAGERAHVVAQRRLKADLVKGRGAQGRHQLPQPLDLGREGGLGVLDPGHRRRVAEHPLLGPLQVVGEHGQALDGPVVELGGHMHPLLLGRPHGPVEHPPALTLGPLDPTHEPGHPAHHQQEQHRPGAGDDGDQEVVAPEPLDDQQGRGDQGGRPHGQQPAPAQASLAPPGRLRQAGPVADGRAAQGEQGQAGGQHRVAGEVDGVGQRRERFDPEDQLVDREQRVADDEQALGGRDQPPGQPPSRPVPADPGGDRGHRRGADHHVQDGSTGLGQQVVGPGRQRAGAQVESPGDAPHPSGGRRARAPV